MPGSLEAALPSTLENSPPKAQIGKNHDVRTTFPIFPLSVKGSENRASGFLLEGRTPGRIASFLTFGRTGKSLRPRLPLRDDFGEFGNGKAPPRAFRG